MARPETRSQPAIELGRRLRTERRRQRKTQKDVSSAVGCAQQTVLDLEAGNVEWSRFLPAIADELQLNVAWLERGEGPKDKGSAAGEALPMVQWDQLTRLALEGVEPEPADWLEGSLVKHSGHAVCVLCDEVSAFAMAGRILPGDWLLIDRKRHDPGLVLAMMGGWPRAELRELSTLGGRHFLRATNPALPAELMPVAVHTELATFRQALQTPGQDVLPALVLGRVIFRGQPE